MPIDTSCPIWCRYYQVPPEEKTLERCYLHGVDHCSYRWNPQVDPRWSEEQKYAYELGYTGEEYDN